jgi:hypothetical protein
MGEERKVKKSSGMNTCSFDRVVSREYARSHLFGSLDDDSMQRELVVQHVWRMSGAI